METLTDKFRQVVDEYARQVAALLGYGTNWSWIGVDDTTGDGTRDVLEVGDWLYFSLSDLQVIIDRLDEWVRRYGSREAVAQEIEDWQEWWLGEEHDGDAPTTEAVLSLWESRRDRGVEAGRPRHPHRQGRTGHRASHRRRGGQAGRERTGTADRRGEAHQAHE